MTLRTWVDTELDVVNIIITYDSKHCIAIVNDKDEYFEVQGYDLNTFEPKFKSTFVGTYIKMNQIEQNKDGTIFAIAYQDNGKFGLKILNNRGTELDKIDLNKFLNIDDTSKPITGFWEPLVCACFIEGDDLFVAVYHRLERIQYHFTYSFRQKKPLSTTTKTLIEGCTQLNFPIKAFYSPVMKKCLVFYRQGQGFTIDSKEPEKSRHEKITEDDLGTMYLLFDQALVARSSSSILFFRID